MKFHAGIITLTGEIKGRAFDTKAEAEAFILEQAEKIGIKVGKIRNLDTGQEEKIEF